jgi:D-serine deaminase-like pyridoxal phosphate-dependent protein
MKRIADLDPAAYALPPELAARLLSPSLVIYAERVRANIGRILSALGGTPERWRVHVKTVKVPEVLAVLVRAGLLGFKCATLREARALARVLAEERVVGGDVLLAHLPVGPALGALAELARARPETRFSVLCEDPEAAPEIPPELDVFADVNSGMDRTGSPLGERGRLVAIARLAGPRFRGLHAYDGHLHQTDRTARRAAIHAIYDELVALVESLLRAGVAVREVVTAGTPSFPDAVRYTGFARLGDVTHRVSPGTVVYHDLRTEEQTPELELEPAALVLCRVISRPGEQLVTTDAGSKSIAVDAGDPCAVALGWPGLEAGRPSEEHLPFRVRSGLRPARGTSLLLAPRHVCPTVNLAEEAVLLDGGDARIVAVAARAHDVLVRDPSSF